MPQKTFLVPTDFSPCAEAALKQAIELGRGTDTRILLVHAYAMPLVGPYDGAIVPNGDVIASIEMAARRGLTDLATRYADCGVPIKTVLKNGDARDFILSMAKEEDAALIVMGTHGRNGIARALLGSVAERIVRTSATPVLTVHAADS